MTVPSAGTSEQQLPSSKMVGWMFSTLRTGKAKPMMHFPAHTLAKHEDCCCNCAFGEIVQKNVWEDHSRTIRVLKNIQNTTGK